jgi:hypothetical protein
MRQLIVIIILLCLPLALNAQTLKGKVYDATSIAINIKVLNKTQNRVSANNKEGFFSIIAKVNDTILFESLIYHPKLVILNKSHFNGITVFELKKIVSELDEVVIKVEPDQPIFKLDPYNLELHNIIKEDIKNNPGLYQQTTANSGVDFIYLIGELAKLFKGKKSKITTHKPISYKQIDSLFDKSSLFNKRLVSGDLNIPKDKANLFYEFCAAKQLSSELLNDSKKMQLLEQLVLNSQLFLILLEEYGEENLKKE